MKNKAIKKSNSKEVEFWIVSHEHERPYWINRLFYLGLMQWINEKKLSYGQVLLRGGGVPLEVGDVLVYDGKTRLELLNLEYMTYKKFKKKYKVLSE
ncbi:MULTISPECIES: hypothetical protein [Lactococcus]|uniref:hypothetical protein n=1 Tax=Lactococcus TaxID=1357 RepID=UPI00203F80A5|nr:MULTISPECIES: hypothetical protein [Lactococcus]